MDKQFEMEGIDWTGKGYFGCPQPLDSSKLPKDLTDDVWVLWLVAFHRARKGDFAAFAQCYPVMFTN